MSKRISKAMELIEYKGKRIMHLNLGMAGDATPTQIRENAKLLAEMGEKGDGDQLHLIEVTGGYATPEIMAAFKEVLPAVKPYTKAAAIVGLSKMQKYLLQTLNRLTGIGTRPFYTIEEAKNWLVEQTNK